MCVLVAGDEPDQAELDKIGTSVPIMPADGHAIPFIALQDGKFNVTEEAAEFLKTVGLIIHSASLTRSLPILRYLYMRLLLPKPICFWQRDWPSGNWHLKEGFSCPRFATVFS